MRTIICLLNVCLFVFFNPLIGQSVTVPHCVSDADQLRLALKAAAESPDDDLIQIQTGTYYGGFVYSSDNASNLTIEGGHGGNCALPRDEDPANTILDGENNQRVMGLVSSAKDGELIISVDDLTVQNGYGTGSSSNGSGLYVAIGSVSGVFSLTNTHILNNHTNGDGGVYYSGTYHSEITVTGNLFKDNIASSNGGGIYIDRTNSIIVSDNEFIGNSAGGYGGAIYHLNNKGTIAVESNTFTDNSGTGFGGAIYSMQTFSINEPFSLLGNTITDSIDGGGVYIEITTAGPVTIQDNFISNNTNGSGLRIVEGSSTSRKQILIVNNVIAYNSADTDYGGGIDIRSIKGDITLTNNTISKNSSGGSGGGIRLSIEDDDSSISLYNNIIWDNSDTDALASDLYIDEDADGDLIYADVELYNNDFDQSVGSGGGFYIADSSSILLLDPSNVNNIDPGFRNPDPALEDYRLDAPSPCINSGHNQAPGLPLQDHDGNPRIMDGDVDMGAYEADGPVLPVALFNASPVSGPVPLTVDFIDESMGTILSWEWDFGDGATSSEQSPSHQYVDAGIYTVSLTATGPEGTSNETKVNLVTADLSPPTAHAGPDRAVALHEITLDGTQSSDFDGEIVAYEWSLIHRNDDANNRTATGAAPTITDLAAGFYDVSLQVTDNDGLTGTDSMVLAVLEVWDVNGNGTLGLAEAIYILRVLSGIE